MRRPSVVALSLVALSVTLLAGCRSAPSGPWEIVAENKGRVSCEVSVDTGAGSGIHAPDLAAGERRILSTGSAKVTVHSVKVVQNRQEQVIYPEAELQAGKRCLVLVEAGGQVRASVSPVSDK